MAISNRNPPKLASAQNGNLFEVFEKGDVAGHAAGTRTGGGGANRTTDPFFLLLFAQQLYPSPPLAASLYP